MQSVLISQYSSIKKKTKKQFLKTNDINTMIEGMLGNIVSCEVDPERPSGPLLWGKK